jgi:hypothetical protein
MPENGHSREQSPGVASENAARPRTARGYRARWLSGWHGGVPPSAGAEVPHGCQAIPVTSVTSLFNSPAADITLDHVRELVSQNLPESLTLEYKETYSPGLVTSVAAMANSYGGLILVGVTD